MHLAYFCQCHPEMNPVGTLEHVKDPLEPNLPLWQCSLPSSMSFQAL